MSAKLTRFREPAKRFLINSAKIMKEPLGVLNSFAVVVGSRPRVLVRGRRFRLLGARQNLGKMCGRYGADCRGFRKKVPRNLKKVPQKNNILRQKKQGVPWICGVASLLDQQTHGDGIAKLVILAVFLWASPINSM